MGSVARFLLKVAGALVLLLLAGLAALWAVGRYIEQRVAPDPTSIVRASLVGLREQNQLSAFAARFVAVVTSRRERLGLSTERTLIMPGSVRYEVDLADLAPGDVRWNAAAHVLAVTLPRVKADPPAIDVAAIRRYGEGGLLTTFTNAAADLDQTNRAAAQKELIAQANAPLPMKLARDATRKAVAENFALPLRAAGLDARVDVRFADEVDGRRWDMSRPLGEVRGAGEGALPASSPGAGPGRR